MLLDFFRFLKRAPAPEPAAAPPLGSAKDEPMSDVSVTVHNFGDLLAGRITFSQFADGEGQMIEQNIASLAKPLQPEVQLAYDSLKAGASALVGIGMTAVGPILAESTDQQTTLVLNLLSLLGVPTVGPLSIAERAILSTAITGLKAGLDRIGIQIATNGTVSVAAAPAAPAAAIKPAA